MKKITVTIDTKTGQLTIQSEGEGACLAARKLGAGLGIQQFDDELTADLTQVNDQEVGL